MTVLPTQHATTHRHTPTTTISRTAVVRKILVDQLIGLGANVEFIRAIPALLAALGPHLDPTPVTAPTTVLINGRPAEAPRVSHPLSPREVQVLQLAAGGHSAREIADQLGIHEDTVKTHLLRIFRRLGVHNRAEAVAVGFRQGILR